jgi:hypothetical protein
MYNIRIHKFIACGLQTRLKSAFFPDKVSTKMRITVNIFQGSSAVSIRSANFWDFMQRKLVVGY